MTIGILGGTGGFGRALAERVRRLGEEVLVGSRSPRDDIVSNAEAARRGELVFLAVPPDGVEATARDLADVLAGKIVVSVASPVVFRDGRPTANPGERSLAELAADAAPKARMIAGFHTVAARALAAEGPIDEDVLLCGDDPEAKKLVSALAERIVTGRSIDCGRLEAARWLETLTVVLLNINRNYRSETGVRITGL
ncbi:MAG: NAD(P)-binding domain-containing protein [Thermoleophilia bacterium]|nr:NAD(P)-binding domain-containing protein [Thermoleophilia bacterium]